MMNKYKLSVLMPVYNTKSEYLQDAIESILNQTFSDFEFLILDDGSTNEDTINVLAKYCKEDSRIRIIKGEHKGIGAALNKLIDEAEGEYLARMDSDDISVSDRFEKQLEYFKNNPEVSILSCNYEAFPKKLFVSNLKQDVKYFDMMRFCNVCHPGVMIRKCDLTKYDLRYSEKMPLSEDYDLWARAIKYVKFANLPDVLLKYRVLEGSNSHKNMDLMFETDKKIRYNMLDFLTDDAILQQKIWDLIFPSPKSRKMEYTFWERIFSVKNFTKNRKKQKIITILGIRIKLPKYENVRIVKLMGGLGNQMFQYAFGKALEIKTGQKVMYDKSWFRDAKKFIVNSNNENSNGVVIRNYDLDLFNIKIKFANSNQLSNCKIKINEKNAFIYDKNLLKKQKSACYEGYFQNESYFKEIKEIIKNEFIFPEISKNDEFNQKWLKRIKECENPVFIHVRRGDYVNLGWDLSVDYYKKSIEYIKKQVKNPTFFIFGQDCEDYIKNEFNLDADYEIIGEENSENKEDWKDIVLMQECKHAIIANSTFSWWAAWLGKANDGIVTAPTPFVNGQDDIICDNWIKIEC